MNNKTVNPQSWAVNFEHFLLKRGYASLGSADTIRKNPLQFLDGVLSNYEKQSEEKDKLSADFWDKYSHYKDKSMDEIGEEVVTQMLKDLKNLF